MAEAASAPATTPLQRLRAFALPAGTVLAFLVFLFLTFPFDTLARRIEIEVQRAGVSLIKIIIAGIVISILVVSAWMGLVAAAIGGAVGAGANWALAVLIAALVNIALAVGLAFWAKKQVPDLLFSATLRQLRKDAPHGENEHEPHG